MRMSKRKLTVAQLRAIFSKAKMRAPTPTQLITIKRGISEFQSGKTTYPVDVKLKAKKVGYRISESGNRYYEGRRNRSDVSRRYKV